MAANEIVIIDILAQYTDNTSGGLSRATRNLDRFQQSTVRAGSSASRMAGDASSGITRATQNLDRFRQTTERSRSSIVRLTGRTWDVVLLSRDRASEAIRRVRTNLTNLIRMPWRMTVSILDRATAPLREIGKAAFSLKGILTGIAVGFAGKKLIADPLALSDQMESSRIFFEKKLGSVEASNQMIKDIQKFDEKSPFNTMQIIQRVQNMMGVGWQQDKILTDLEAIGDASSGLGLGDEGVEAIVRQLGQIKAKGKAQGEELMVLRERGLMVNEYLAQGYGVSKEKIATMQEKGELDGDTAVKHIIEGMRKDFGGSAAANSDRTIKGILGQVESLIESKIVLPWGDGLAKGAKKGLGVFKSLLDKNADKIASWGEKLSVLGEGISMALADKFEQAVDKLDKIFSSDEFQNASLGDKFKILWDEIVYQPFSEWWNGDGGAKFKEKAKEVGEFIGSAIASGIGNTLEVAVENVLPTIVQSTGDVIEGRGEPMDYAIAAAGGYGAYKIGKGLFSFGKGVYNTGRSIGDLGTTVVQGGRDIASAVRAADAASGLNAAARQFSAPGSAAASAEVFLRNADQLADIAEVGAGASGGLKGVGKAIPVIGTVLGLAGSAAAIASAPKEERVKETIGEAGGWVGAIGGGAAAGAGLGAALGALGANPVTVGIGGVVGSVGGGIAGAIGGEKAVEYLYDKKDDIAQWFKDTGTNVGGWFKDTGASMKEWYNNTKDSTKDWAKDTGTKVGGWFKDTGAAMKDWYSNTKDSTKEWAGNAISSTKDFFSAENLGMMAGEAAGKLSNAIDDIGRYWSNDVPTYWKNKVDEWGTYWSSDVPEYWKRKTDEWGTYWTTDVPEYWKRKTDEWGAYWQGVGEYWNTKVSEWGAWWAGVPAYWNAKVAEWGTWWAGVPGYWKNKVQEWKDWWNGVPEYWKTKVQEWKDWWNGIPEYWRTKIEEWGSYWQGVGQYWKDKIDGIGNWFGGFFDIFKTGFDNEKQKGNAATNKSNSGQGGVSKISDIGQNMWNNFGKPYANGGILARPTVALMGEEYPEAIIPLDPKRRSRSLELWQEVGNRIGAKTSTGNENPVSVSGTTAFATGGIVGATGGSSPSSMKIDIGGMHFNIQGGGDAQSIMAAIREHMPSIANDVANEIAVKLSRIYTNMPLAQGG